MKADWTFALRFERTVRGMARKKVAGFRPDVPVEVDELVSVGLIAIALAGPYYDPKLGPLRGFVEDRIEYAFKDYLRALDPLGRRDRLLMRQLVYAEDAGDEEEARRLREELEPVKVRAVFSLEAAPSALRTGRRPLESHETIPDPNIPDPDEEMFYEQQVANLYTALARMPERERFVLTLYYFEDMTLEKIALVLGVTPSRVSQLKSKGELRLRFALRRQEWPAEHRAPSYPSEA